MPKAAKYLSAILFFCLLLCACKRNPTTWEDNIVAPLASGNLSLANLFPDTLIKTNADSSLVIAFESNLIKYDIDSLLKIPDTTIVTNLKDTIFPLPLASGHQGILGFSVNPTENNFNFPNGIELSKAIVKQGRVKVQLSNNYAQPLLYEYQLPSASKNGKALDTTFYIPGGSTANPGTTSCYINLAGYSIDFTGANHNTYNTILQNGALNTAPNALADTIQIGQGLIANFTFMGIVPQYALGYFGSQSITVGPDTAAFTAFNAIKKGMLNLNSATVSLQLVNQFGVALQASISGISSINTNNPGTVNLSSSSAGLNKINIPAAHDNNGPSNPFVSITPAPLAPIVFNNGNSNVKDFIGNLPGRLSYKLNARINPPVNGSPNQSLGNDFGYYGTSFSANLNINVPLFFSASNLLLADTISLNLGGVNQLKNVNGGNLILTATNSFPFIITLNAQLLDVNKHVIDNLSINTNTIAAAPLNANGKVSYPLKSKLYIPLTPAKISSLQKAKYIYYSASFNTVNQPAQVKFYSNYTLDLLLTADINYTLGK
jgi:hypothetical protein